MVASGLVGRLPMGLSAILTAAILVSLLWFSRYGFDFTDESFYLVWMANPANYAFSVSQFGFIYHPLYSMLGGDIGALRQVNIIIIFGLAWVVCDLFLKGLLPQSSGPAYARFVTSAGIATSSLAALVFAGLWLPTPGYNSLAFKGLLITTIGLLLGDKTASRTSTFGWLLIGLGGWLAFMAKPTTAAVAGLSVTVYILVSGKLSMRSPIALLSFLICLLLSAVLIDGSIAGFINRYQVGLEFASMLGGGHSSNVLFRIDDFQLSLLSTEIFWLIVLVAISGLVVSILATAGARVVVSLMQIAMITIGLVGVYWISLQADTFDSYQGLMLGAVLMATIPVGISTLSPLKFLSSFSQVLIIVLGFVFFYLQPLAPLTFHLGFDILQRAVLLALIAIFLSLFRYECHFARRGKYLALVIPFLGFTYAYAFGTNNNYWIPIGGCGFFIVLIGVLAVSHLAGRKEFSRMLLTVAIVVQVVSLGLLVRGLQHPYRQPSPIFNNDYAIDLGTQGGRLMLENGFGEYISVARNVVALSGFNKGAPMIDMTGHSPGLLHAIGAESVGLAWTLGGYPSSAEYVERALRLVPCKKLAQAWLITEAKGPRPIPERVLESFGANLLASYEVAGVLQSPEGVEQTIYKPAHSQNVIETVCSEIRVSQL